MEEKAKPTKTLSLVTLKAIKRSPLLITTFPQGFTSDWKFKLPEAYSEALDIRVTERMVKQKPVPTRTQGTNFYFREGDIIYYTSLAYTLVWGDALRVIRFAIRVTAASPEALLARNQYTIEEEKKTLRLFLLKPESGTVCFDLLKVEDGALVTFRSFEASQVEFVRFLQQGVMVDAKDEQVCLSKLHDEAFPNANVAPMVGKRMA